MFDPYHKWLGIPPDQRPPTYYQLLGLSPGEDDAEVIAEAAIRQAAHVRSYQIGPHAAESVRILNEIAEASRVLRDPAKRRAYDQILAHNGPVHAITELEEWREPPTPRMAPETDFAYFDRETVRVDRRRRVGRAPE